MMMADCIHPESGEELRAVLSGTLGYSFYTGTLGSALWHLRNCPACADEHPHGEESLRRLKHDQDLKIAEELRRVMHEFEGRRHVALARAGAEQDPGVVILADLIITGWDMQDYLDYVTEFGGLAFFKVLPDRSDSEETEAWRNCADFFVSIDSDLRDFIFRSTLALQVFFFKYVFDVRAVPGEEGEVPAGKKERWRALLETALIEAGVNCSLLMTILAESGRNLANAYLREHCTVRPGATQETECASAGESFGLEELHRDMVDSADSLKAGQMEIMRKLDSIKLQAADCERTLRQLLSEELFRSLHPGTIAALTVAEHLYRVNSEPAAADTVIMKFCQGFWNEFQTKLLDPLCDMLVRSGTLDYDARGLSRQPLMRAGKLNTQLSLGQAVWYLRDVPTQQMVRQLGFDPGAIVGGAEPIVSARNSAAHGSGADQRLLEEIRRQILNPVGVLALLQRPGGRATSAG